MIYVVTPNPSLDYNMRLDSLNEGKMNRAEETGLLPGGKGINVATVLKNLGMQTVCLGFIGGFTGQELYRKLDNAGIGTDFIWLKNGETRINVKISTNVETEVNAPGPVVEEKDILALMKQMEEIQDGDTLVLSGSVPKGMPELYSQLMQKLINKKDRKIKCIVDATGDTLKNTLPLNPFLIKPNLTELEELLNKKMTTEYDVIEGATALQKMGAENVLVSMGEEGAILVCPGRSVMKIRAPKGNVINTVGAGDSMVAGFIYGYEKTDDLGEALRFAVAAGSASAFSPLLAMGEEINALLNSLCYTVL